MATALYVQKPEDFSSAAEYLSPWLDRMVSPRAEALSLFALVGRKGDNTVESVRELIAVPPETEAALLLYAQENPEDAQGIGRVLEFRRNVAEEFERLAAKSCGATPLEEAASRGRAICSVGLTEVLK